MKNSVRTIPANGRDSASTDTSQCSDGDRKCAQIGHTLRKTGLESAAIVQSDSNLRITRPAQLRIIGLFLQGCSFCEIVRRTGYARQTVTKVCRSEDVQAAIRETKGILLGESGAWAESLNYAVTHETDGKLSYQLLKDFGLIPSTGEPEPEK